MGLIAWWTARKARKELDRARAERAAAWERAVASALADGATRETMRGATNMVVLDGVPDASEAPLRAVGFRRTGTPPEDAAVPGVHSRTWIWMNAAPPRPTEARGAPMPLDTLNSRR